MNPFNRLFQVFAVSVMIGACFGCTQNNDKKNVAKPALATPTDNPKWIAWQLRMSIFVAESKSAIAMINKSEITVFKKQVASAAEASLQIPATDISDDLLVRTKQITLQNKAKECTLELHSIADMLRQKADASQVDRAAMKASALLSEIEADTFFQK